MNVLMASPVTPRIYLFANEITPNVRYYAKSNAAFVATFGHNVIRTVTAFSHRGNDTTSGKKLEQDLADLAAADAFLLIREPWKSEGTHLLLGAALAMSKLVTIASSAEFGGLAEFEQGLINTGRAHHIALPLQEDPFPALIAAEDLLTLTTSPSPCNIRR